MSSIWEQDFPFSAYIHGCGQLSISHKVAPMFRLKSLALLVVLGILSVLPLIVLPGCGGTPPSELTPEQLEKQMAEDAQSWADEDRAEKEQMAKQRRGK